MDLDQLAAALVSIGCPQEKSAEMAAQLDNLDLLARRDLPAIQGSVLFLSAVFVMVNLLTDVAYAKADPRVRYD